MPIDDEVEAELGSLRDQIKQLREGVREHLPAEDLKAESRMSTMDSLSERRWLLIEKQILDLRQDVAEFKKTFEDFLADLPPGFPPL